jgi:long-subunit fatty acid transport protein
VSDFGFTGGLQYKLFWGDSSWRKLSKDVNSFHTTTIGFNYNVGRALATSREYLSIRYLTVNGATQIVDTTSLKFSKKDSSGTIGIPASMGFGLAFEDFRHWMIAGDFVWYDWSKANFFNQSSVYGTSFGMHLGGYYLPDGFKGETFWERTTYRAGFRYFQTGMQIKSTPINEWAFSLGLTLPNKQRNNPLSGYTIAIELGQRGTIKNDLIRDNFMKVTLAFNLTDRFPWFIQSKYD